MERMEEARLTAPRKFVSTPVPVGDDARASVYTLLARLLVSPPDAEVLATLRAIDPVDGANLEQREPGMARAWQVLRLAAERAEVAALDDEYHDLFIGLGRGELVPYASWYLTGFMMDRPLAVLRADLSALGFERQDEVREPEDHVAALCEVMAMLVGDGESLDVQRDFYLRHLDGWINTFCLDLQKARTAHFYRAVGALAEAFFDIERKYLTIVM